MNRAVRDEWVRRLRSGDYAQGRGQLVRLVNLVGDGPAGTVPGEYCCLGVLCEVAVEAGVVTRFDDGYLDPRQPRYRYNGALPPSVVEWAGLSDSNPGIGDVPLSSYNDGRWTTAAYDFTAIARLIEENL